MLNDEDTSQSQVIHQESAYINEYTTEKDVNMDSSKINLSNGQAKEDIEMLGNNGNTSKYISLVCDDMEDLACIDFFLRYLSYLFPLWAEYGDNLMFHIIQIYGATSSDEYEPYRRIMDHLNIRRIYRDYKSEFSSSDISPVNVQDCSMKTCIEAITQLDYYREWLEYTLLQLSGILKIPSAIDPPDCCDILENGKSILSHSIKEWKPLELTNVSLPLAYQTYVSVSTVNDSGKKVQNSNLKKKDSILSSKIPSTPSKNGNEVGVTYEKNRDRWVAVWTENGIRRSRIFNVKQYGYETARELAIQHRRDQLAQINGKNNSSGNVSSRRSKKVTSIENTRKSPSNYNTRNSGSLNNTPLITSNTPNFNVYLDSERESWICKDNTTMEEVGSFSIQEFGSEQAEYLANEKAGITLEFSQTPIKRNSLSSYNEDQTQTKRTCSSTFRIRTSSSVLAETSGGIKSDPRKLLNQDESMIIHGKKYFFGPIVEGVRYDRIQNRWVTGYISSDGRKRYKYFSIGAYGFEGSRQLAIEYRESVFGSTKGVHELMEYLQTVIQGFPAYEDGSLKDFDQQDVVVHQGLLKGFPDKYYLCIPTKGDFLVTTPANKDDPQVLKLLNEAKLQVNSNDIAIEENTDSNFQGNNFTSSTTLDDNKSNLNIDYDTNNRYNTKIKQEDTSFFLNTNIDETLSYKKSNINNSSLKSSSNIDSLTKSSKDKGHIQDSQEPQFSSSPAQSITSKRSLNSPTTDSSPDFQISNVDNSLYIETEDKTTSNSRKRFFIGPQIAGVFYNPGIHRWVSQYEVDGVKLSKNFSAKSYGFEKSRYMAIKWRTQYHGEPPELPLLIESLRQHGIEYPPLK
ncbi:AP2 domain-containing protein [Cryptosporidium andersoni]|uniref:AP2 domain-containing protein n=1 Tax=Cryptosporidium andersoni TaxID=117008 RepID=A0A1J4MA21_9CRYT|nr:AP2 domain-containing protein [Cryptosporidium andersoni]